MLIPTPGTKKVRKRTRKYANGMIEETTYIPPDPARKTAHTDPVNDIGHNDESRIKELTRLINHNFSKKDYTIRLSYTDKELNCRKDSISTADSEQADRELIELAHKDIAEFVRKIKNKVPDVKYIMVPSTTKWYSAKDRKELEQKGKHAPRKGKKKVRLHIHGILSGNAINWYRRSPRVGNNPIDKLWGLGHCATRHLYGEPLPNGNENYGRLARYLIKQATTHTNQKRYTASHTIEKPEFVEEERPVPYRQLSVPSGADVVGRRYNARYPVNQSVTYVY